LQQLDQQLTDHLRDRIFWDDDNQRLLDGIGLQHDRGHLLRFLKMEGVEPTNNRAERILRPTVIARKVSHCPKNQRGADAFPDCSQDGSANHFPSLGRPICLSRGRPSPLINRVQSNVEAI
jgi:Transposase IS66 family